MLHFLSLLFALSQAVALAVDLPPQIIPSGKFFELILDHVETVYENKDFIEWHLKVRRINRTRTLMGYIDVKVPFGNDIKKGVKILKKQGGEYRYLPYKTPDEGLCKLNSADVYVYPEIAKNSDFPADIGNACPLKIGNYTFHGVTFNLENAPRVIFPSGDYAGEVTYTNADGKIIEIFRCYCQINQI